MLWCIHDTVDLLKKNPPPPLGVHDLDSILGEYERLSKCADTESIEIYAGTEMFLKLQVKTKRVLRNNCLRARWEGSMGRRIDGEGCHC